MYDSISDKGNISISWRYQVHLASSRTKCPKDITDAHNQQQKRRISKKKYNYNDQFLVTAAQTTTKDNTRSPYSLEATLPIRK